MKKEELKNYNIICTNEKETKECMDMLEELGFDINNYNNFTDFNCIVYYSKFFNEFSCKDTFCHSRKKINFYQFKKLYKKLIKKTKDFEVNDKGQIIKINNYESKKAVYFLSEKTVYYADFNTDDFIRDIVICKAKKEFLDHLIQLGLPFKTRRDCVNFIDCCKNKRRNDF